jgi:hypothetical protein
MPELPEVYPPLDLTRYTEATRRDVYARVVAIQFTEIETADDPENTYPVYDPDDSGLVVFYVFGRWFATWVDLDAEPDDPEDRWRELVRIESAPNSPEGIILYEV